MTKNFHSLILSAWLILPATAAEFWVAPDGNDANPGTAGQPFASIAAAQRQARELRRLSKADTNEPVRILLGGGVYHLDSPLFFRPEDSGTEASPTLIEAAPNEQPVISGGVLIQGWKKAKGKTPGLPAAARDQVWVADAPKFGGRPLAFRQLWVNERKAIRAREPNGDTLNRLVAWNKTSQEAWIPGSAAASAVVRRALAPNTSPDGNIEQPGRPIAKAGDEGVVGSARGGRAPQSQLEMIIDQVWEIAVLRVKSLRPDGDKVCLTFHQPESKIEFEHPWPPVEVSTNYQTPFFLANAIELLDAPGEWFADPAAGKVYYWPRPGEDMTQAKVVAPALETLVRVEGTLDRPVEHLAFRGIRFEHATWLRPAEAGHVPLQASMFMLEAYKLKPAGTAERPKLENQAWLGRSPGGVSVANANHISFARCRFEHMASAGLDVQSGTRDDLIEGCIFRDLGGNGIQIGKFADPGMETHLAYLPADEREICTRETIANNLVTDCGTEDWGCVGIIAGYVRQIAIQHNEVSHLPYTGISAGWGWTRLTNCMADNVIFANHIHHVATRMGDTAAIYMLSAQPGAVVSDNYIHDLKMSPYVPDPDHWFYLYLDEGSSFTTVRDNWCPAEKFLKNANGPGNVWENNGPLVSDKIKNAAGLETLFRDLLSEER
jgi:hypothetical protein